MKARSTLAGKSLNAWHQEIRAARPEDAEAVAKIYAPAVEDSIISFEFAPPTVAEVKRRIEETLLRFPWLVWEKEGEILGYAYASEHRSRRAYQWCVEVSVYVREDARRQGVAKSLYEKLFEILRRQGFYNAYAGIALPNDASVRLHEGLGFKKIGVYRAVGHKLGGWRDVGRWHLVLQPHKNDPPPPLNFPELK
ncbi:MAG: N-acetyltransferase [Elusimicrobia bacterium]|nr:N-acetyltransferase [Elusimicrobiota bacterium]